MWHWLAIATAPALAREIEVLKAELREARSHRDYYERQVIEYLKGERPMAENNSGVNIGAPVQKVVQVGLGQVAQSLDAALATLDALEDIPYHAAEGGIGLVHSTFEGAIAQLRAGLEQAAQDAQTAVEQAGGVTTIGGGQA